MKFKNIFKRSQKQSIITLPQYNHEVAQKKHDKQFQDVYKHDWQKIMRDQMRVKNDVKKVSQETFSFDPTK